MPAEGYIVGFSIIFVFLAIGVVAMKSGWTPEQAAQMYPLER
jgi:hypothetical protein